jgi:hypothetical protein
MGVRRVPRAHSLDRCREQAGTVEDIGILGEEAEDQSRHEMIHVRAAIGCAPFRIVLQKLDIEPVQAASGANIEGAVADLFDGGDPGERQKEAEMVREIGIGAGNRIAGRQVFGLERLSIGREGEFSLGSGSRRAGLERGESLRNLAGTAIAIWMLLV